MFATLSDRLAETFKNLRGKGRLSEADIDATAREIRVALLDRAEYYRRFGVGLPQEIDTICCGWLAGWSASTLGGINVDDQFTVFGASGCIVFGLLSGLIMMTGKRIDSSTA